MINQRVENLVDILGERYLNIENSFVLQNNKQLTKYLNLNNITAWKSFQESGTETYRKVLIKMASQVATRTANQIEKIMLLSYKTISPKNVIITENEILAKDLPKSFVNKIAKEKKIAIDQIHTLAEAAYSSYVHNVKVIGRSKTVDTFYEKIFQQTKQGIEKGVAVNYRVKKGKYAGTVRKVSFKSYMEMNSRTTISNEITKQQISAGAKTGLIFYMCDSFADCAKDHQKYQGKIYYNEKAKLSDEAREYIQSHNIMSMQKAMDAPIYLTTRPNCRHAFHVLNTEKVIKNNTSGYKKTFTHGKFETNNYKLTQRQRANERLIRKYKLLKENNNALYESTKEIKYKKAAAQYEMLEAKWTKGNKELIASNKGLLKRNKWRETTRAIVDDLGVKYDLNLEA